MARDDDERPPGSGASDGRDREEGADPSGSGGEGEAEDLGEPVALLSGLALEPAPGFFGRFHRRVNRRLLVADVATFSWKAWAQALLEYLVALFASFNPDRDTDKGAG